MEIEIPFSPSYPVDPQYFVNRSEILTAFRHAISRSIKTKYPTPDNIAILGNWGIGKTSVLKKFEAIALEEFPKRQVFCSMVELMPVSCDSFSAFADKVIDDIERNFIAKSSLIVKLRNELQKWHALSVGISGIASAGRKIRSKSPATDFKNNLINLWKMLEKLGVDTAIIMLDDLYYLADQCPSALYDLRAIFQGLPRHGCNFMLCCTGKIEMFSRIRELAEPLSRFFNIKYSLSAFSYDETKAAILTPIEKSGIDIKIDEAIIMKIYNLSAGHPFFIHFIMRELLVLNESKKIIDSAFGKLYPKVREAMDREKFGIDYSIASSKEKEILEKAACLPSNTFTPQEIKVKGGRQYFRTLVNKNLIIKHDRGEYSLYHSLFKEYLRTK